jgi:hypothetical protein
VKNLVIPLLALAVGLAGCSSANVSARGGSFATTATPQAGTSVSGGSVGVNIQGGSAAGAVVAVATIAAIMGVWRDAPPGRAAPDMLEGRAISERDCTKPIEDWSANLKCK